MVYICLLLLLALILLEDEGLGPTETVMQLSDWIGVAKHQPAILGGQLSREIVEFLEVGVDGDGCVEENG
jgi:hypothetical protein